MIRPLNDKKGMALLLVISLISVLAVITLQFGRDMRDFFLVSASLGNETRLALMAKSGITIAGELLAEDQKENSFDSPQDSWALLQDEDLSTLFDFGSLQVAVFDEGGKFQINAMISRKSKELAQEEEEEEQRIDPRNIGQRRNPPATLPGQELNPETPAGNNQEQDGNNANTAVSEKDRLDNIRNVLWRLLRAEPFMVEDGDARKIIDSLIDWMDSGDGDGEEEYGAEDSYYQSLDPPYSCKNGPIESIEELLLVKGITRELLYGDDEHPPLAPLLTPLGNDGKININTADPLILQALAEAMTQDTAEAMFAYREDEENSEQLKNTNWYKNVPSFPGDIELQQDLISVASSFFTIQARAEFGSQHKTITATVERSKTDLNILRWDSN